MFDDLNLYKSKVELYRDTIPCFIPQYLLDKKPELLIEGKNLLKKYPKFQTVRNMVSAFIKNKWLTICPICNKRRIKYQSCIRRKENITCGHPECKRKQTQFTSIEKYGVSNPMNRKEAIEKRRKDGWYVWNAHIDRKHNTKFINHYKKIKKRLEENHLLGINTIDDYKGVLEEKTGRYIKYDFICDICGNKIRGGLHSIDFPYCKNCHPKEFKNCIILNNNGKSITARVSDTESELFEFCKSLDNTIVRNKKGLLENKKQEIDIFSSQLNLGIEFNGIYWHTEKYRPKLFHYNKTNAAEKAGINLIHIFEDEWKTKQFQVKNILRKKFQKSLFVINANKCIVKEIDKSLSKKFLEKYHIEGYAPSSIHFGLFYKNRLVSVLSLAKCRTNKKYDYELLRYASINLFKIENDLKTLFDYFCNSHKGNILFKADRRWNFEKEYIDLGFEIINISKPEYFYSKREKRFHHKLFLKSTLKKKLKKFDAKLSEAENMKLNGYHRLWDAGYTILEYKNK